MGRAFLVRAQLAGRSFSVPLYGVFVMECSVLSLRRSSRSHRPQIQVEQLEQRWCPDGSKCAPQLSYSVSMNDPNVTISGQVYANNSYLVENASVQFSGAVSTSVTTDASGAFSFTVAANYLGTITGIAWDNEGTMSSPVENQIGSAPPAISFSVSQSANNVWEISGHADSECLGGNLVTLSGLSACEGSSTYTDADGNFSMVLWLPDLDPNQSYCISASVSDCWGLSGSATAYIN
jgi:hypothetical protein